jgi:branched-chain amino acid transport system ATP-binding protein
MLRLESVSKEFGGLRAVRELDLQLAPGELTGLIGPNGAGKTTVTNLITGLMSLTAGRIMFGERDITELEPHDIARAGIARTFQTSRLFKRMSVLDNVVVAIQESADDRVSTLGCLLGRPRAYRLEREWRARARELLTRFGIERHADDEARTLSYGVQRRVEIARALALSPTALLLDEPVAGMNDAEAAQLGVIFRQLRDEGMAVLLIEHNVPFVTSICDQVNVLSHGQLIASGTPESVVCEPAVIEAYLGS